MLTKSQIEAMTGVTVNTGCVQYVNDCLKNHPEDAKQDVEYVTELVTEFMDPCE